MLVTLTAADRARLAAASQERRVRRWRRYQASLLLADGQPPPQVAQALGCGVSSVYQWATAWRRDGLAGVTEQAHGGGHWALDPTGEEALVGLLEINPQIRGHQATSWAVPLLLGKLQRLGYRLSDHTVRRALHRLGYHWKRPLYVLGRPGPEYTAKTTVSRPAVAMLAGGGEV